MEIEESPSETKPVFRNAWLTLGDTRAALYPNVNKVNIVSNNPLCRSQWSRGLRRGSVAARLLRLGGSNPEGAWMSVMSAVCFQVEASATD